VDIANDSKIGDREDGSLGVLVDGDDVLCPFHPDHVLGGPGDSGGQVDGWFDGLGCLADLMGVGDPSGVDDGSGLPGGPTEETRQSLDQLVGLRVAQAAAAGDDGRSLVESGVKPTGRMPATAAASSLSEVSLVTRTAATISGAVRCRPGPR
jgi:hypothetical protein